MRGGNLLDWERLTTVELAALERERAVVVLPVAAVEQHGPHLPLGTDAFIVEALIAAASARLPAGPPLLRLPAQCIGASPEHGLFAGTLSLEPEAVLALWTAIGRSVAAAGFRRLVIVNGHGGQGGLVDATAVRLRRDAGLLVVRASYYRFAPPPGLIPDRERRYGLHGGMVETALMLAIAPALVRSSAIADFPSAAETWEAAWLGLSVEGDAGIGWLAGDLSAAGVTGDAAAATPEMGAALLDHYAGRLAGLLGAVRAMPIPWPAGTPAP